MIPGDGGILYSFRRDPKRLQDRLGFGTRSEARCRTWECWGALPGSRGAEGAEEECGGLRSWDPGAAQPPPIPVHRDERGGTLQQP